MASTSTAPINGAKPTTSEVTVTNNGVKTEKLYFSANDVLGEMPITLIEQLTALTKKKFSDDFLAQVSDEKLKGYRLMYLVETISAAHKQHEKMVRERKEKKARESYKEYRSKGVSKEDAAKISGYNPDLE